MQWLYRREKQVHNGLESCLVFVFVDCVCLFFFGFSFVSTVCMFIDVFFANVYAFAFQQYRRDDLVTLTSLRKLHLSARSELITYVHQITLHFLSRLELMTNYTESCYTFWPVEKNMNELQCEPEQLKGRIIVMSIFNDPVWRERGNTEKCIMNSVTVANYARRFLLGRWSFLGPGSEKK